MSQFQVIANIEVPKTEATRARGPFATAVDSLEVGSGFHFSDTRDLKKLYPTVSPKKFGGKKFKLWVQTPAGTADDGSVVSAVYGVARLS